MKKNNCLRCNFRHTDNGNCTAVGGFCTAVQAAHCPLLRQYLDTELTPEEVSALIKDWSDRCTAIGECGGIDRLRELSEADKDGRVAVLPCKPDGSMLNTLTVKRLRKASRSVIASRARRREKTTTDAGVAPVGLTICSTR